MTTYNWKFCLMKDILKKIEKQIINGKNACDIETTNKQKIIPRSEFWKAQIQWKKGNVWINISQEGNILDF